MFILAHMSDLHMASRPTLAELGGKRGLGFINWHRKRKHIHRPDVLDAMTRDVKTLGADHIAVTGDLVNFSLADEYDRARAWLDALGDAHDVTVIPGNHDVYVPGVVQSPGAYWADYMRGDNGMAGFPFVRRRGDVALIALSTGVPSGPFMATGRLGTRQLSHLAEALDETRGLFRVVLIHHPPMSPPKRHLRRLTDAEQFRRVLADHGAELLLHGHDHRRSVHWLEGSNGTKIPAIGAPSASASAPHGSEDAAGYNVFRIEPKKSTWRLEMIARQRQPHGSIGEIATQIIA